MRTEVLDKAVRLTLEQQRHKIGALHSGPVAFASLDGLISRTGQTTLVGDTVAAALKLFQGEPRLSWPVAASAQTVRLAAGTVRTGQRALVEVPGRSQPLDMLEILSLA